MFSHPAIAELDLKRGFVQEVELSTGLHVVLSKGGVKLHWNPSQGELADLGWRVRRERKGPRTHAGRDGQEDLALRLIVEAFPEIGHRFPRPHLHVKVAARGMVPHLRSDKRGESTSKVTF